MSSHSSISAVVIPITRNMLLPFLKLLRDKKSHTIGEVTNEIAKLFEVTEDDRKVTIKGQRRKFDNRVRWVVSMLRHAGLCNRLQVWPRKQFLQAF